MKTRVAIVQRDIAWQDVGRNLRALETMLADIRADVVVLSEMFPTGFVTTPAVVVDDGTTLGWMATMAARLDAAIVGSVVVREADGYHNRMYFVMPTGEFEWYDKRHLFMGGEADNFVCGTERKVVAWRGVRYLMEVCYDLRFPVWSRQRGDYDAIIYSALWPKPRREVWRTLLRARAIENQAYVIGVNRIGSEPGLEYAGDSTVVDAYGRTMTDLADGEAVEVVELDMDALTTFRKRFNVLADADSFVIK
ncbi:MAG: nitrilase family protein [Alistipes sp.]|nr:nitrilase family protein [Alistipes sp.]